MKCIMHTRNNRVPHQKRQIIHESTCAKCYMCWNEHVSCRILAGRSSIGASWPQFLRLQTSHFQQTVHDPPSSALVWYPLSALLLTKLTQSRDGLQGFTSILLDHNSNEFRAMLPISWSICSWQHPTTARVETSSHLINWLQTSNVGWMPYNMDATTLVLNSSNSTPIS